MIGNITIIKYMQLDTINVYVHPPGTKYKIKFKQSPDIAVDLSHKTDANSTSVIKWDLENPSGILMNWFCRHALYGVPMSLDSVITTIFHSSNTCAN